jgi:hypothetical protein
MQSYIQLTRPVKVPSENRVKGFMRLPAFDVYPVNSIKEVQQYYVGKKFLPGIIVEGNEVFVTDDSYRALTPKECKYFNQEVYVTKNFEADSNYSPSISLKIGQTLFIDGFTKGVNLNKWIPFFILGNDSYLIPYENMELRAPIDKLIYQKEIPESLWNWKEP